MTTWTPKTRQSEAWTVVSQEQHHRVFDPDVFDHDPIFDTGTPTGLWTERTKQPETWTPV